MPTDEDLQKILATSDLRHLNAHMRAVLLVQLHHATQTQAARVTGLNRKTVKRALCAVKDDRIPGLDGRPRLISKPLMDQRPPQTGPRSRKPFYPT